MRSMKAQYLIEIEDPKTHYVKVRYTLSEISEDKLSIFLPSWSPGSYLMREYVRHLQKLQLTNIKGKEVQFEQKAKGLWEIETKGEQEITIRYEVYCHELSVRTSFIDDSHAFLHGPSYLMGTQNEVSGQLEVEFKFPPLWSKLNTGLKDISTDRQRFIYSAENYDVLIDAPVEIGCQETDGFQVAGKNHFLAFYGNQWPHKNDLKADIKKIVEYVSEYWGEIPYKDYTFITHFAPNYFGGLEHLNSTVLAYDGRRLNVRKDYIRWLTLVTHEYFHTWNVKRIRPAELGPFDYINENYTTMLWLAEGLTSFMDNYLTYKTGLITDEEYWELIKDDFNLYLNTPGRKFDSLEQSSHDAWIKLYRPHENSRNATVSYYLKGGLVFLGLHIHLKALGKDSKDLTDKLWSFYKDRPKEGINTEEFLNLISELSNENVTKWFSTQISTTEEMDFEGLLNKLGITCEWEEAKPSFGAAFEYKGERVLFQSVQLDGASFKAGFNAGDELISINGGRVLKADIDKLTQFLPMDQNHMALVSRQGRLVEVPFQLEKGIRTIKKIQPGPDLDW